MLDIGHRKATEQGFLCKRRHERDEQEDQYELTESMRGDESFHLLIACRLEFFEDVIQRRHKLDELCPKRGNRFTNNLRSEHDRDRENIRERWGVVKSMQTKN